MIKIVKLNDIDEKLWDNYVNGHPEGNYSQHSKWHKIIKNTYGHNTHFLACVKTDTKNPNDYQLAGILPIVHLKHFMFGNELVSMPFLDLGGILVDDDESERHLLSKAIDLYKSLGADRLELRQSNIIKSCENKDQENKHLVQEEFYKGRFNDDNYIVMKNKVRMLLDLPESSDLLMKSFKSKLRSQIKRPIKEGLKYNVGGKELLNDFYKIFCKNMHDLGSPVHSKKLMANILSEFQNSVRTFAVYMNNEPVAASFTIGFKKVLSNPWASSLRKFSRLAPNMLLYWAMLEYACDNGYDKFDFGRSTPDEGTYRFKKQWGAKPIPISKYVFGRHIEPESGYQSGIKRQAAEAIWKKLPMSITKILGPKIRKHISL